MNCFMKIASVDLVKTAGAVSMQIEQSQIRYFFFTLRENVSTHVVLVLYAVLLVLVIVLLIYALQYLEFLLKMQVHQ